MRTRNNKRGGSTPPDERATAAAAAAAARDNDSEEDLEEDDGDDAIRDEEQDNAVENQVRGEEDDHEEHGKQVGDVEEETVAPAAAARKSRNRSSSNSADAADQEGTAAAASPPVEGKNATDRPTGDLASPASAVLAASQPGANSPNMNNNSRNSGHSHGMHHHYIYPRRKVPPPLALHNLNDLVDYYVERIFAFRRTRRQDWACLKYFWGLHPGNECEFGYYHVRVRLAELLVDAHAGGPTPDHHHASAAAVGSPPPLDSDSDERDDGTDDPNGLPPPPPKANDWTRERWIDIMDDLKETVELVKRRDATVRVVAARDDAHEDAQPAGQADGRVPARLYRKVLRRIRLHAALAPMRKQIEAVMAGTRPDVDAPLLREFANHCEGSDERKVHQLRGALLVPTGIGLRDVTALKSVFEQPGLDFRAFQGSLEDLVHRMSALTFGKRVPELFAFRYGLPPTKVEALDAPEAEKSLSFDGGAKAAAAGTFTTGRNGDVDKDAEDRRPRDEDVRDLRQDREALRHTVRDPLPSARKRAAHAAGAARIRDDRVGSGAERGTDSADEDETTLELSELGPPLRRRSKMFRADEPHPPEPGLFDDVNGRALKRRRWTDEEKAALKLGVKMHGTGQWALIKRDHPLVLRNRHNVQLKDCWRTMVKRGEVQDPFHPDAPEPHEGDGSEAATVRRDNARHGASG